MFRNLFLTFALILSAFTASFAAEYPVLYLRGEQNGWQAKEEYRLTCDADGIYSITVPELRGQFKIADSRWDIQFGAPSAASNEIKVVAGQQYTMLYGTAAVGARGGKNWGCDGIENVTLSFRYEPDKDLVLSVSTVDVPVTGLSGTLPVLYINVYSDDSRTSFDNEIISTNLAHKNYFTVADYYLDASYGNSGFASVGSKESPLPLQIKARGNWTRIGFAKKPFKLKLDKKQNLLGLSKSKHFALLAHADDYYGYLRNFTGFSLGKRIGLPWTPSQQPVEVVINGDYRGLYFLTESIRVDADRVDIAEQEDLEENPALASGGYIVELDNYDEENQIRMSEKSCLANPGRMDVLRITYDTPEEYSAIQKRFITDQFTAMNNAVGANSDILWSYMDIDDAARYYLVEEIVSHTEAYHGSTYLYRDRGEGMKWHFTPLWDFGNAFNGSVSGFFYNNSPFGNTWIPSLRQNGKFNSKVSDTWVWFMQNGFNGIYEEIESYALSLRAAALADYRRWNGVTPPAGGTGVADNRDMTGKAYAVVSHLKQKTAFLSTVFGDYATLPAATEPSRDTTAAAPLPDYLAGIGDIDADQSYISEPEYFTITGIRINKPVPGMLLLEKRGNTVRKIVCH